MDVVDVAGEQGSLSEKGEIGHLAVTELGPVTENPSSAESRGRSVILRRSLTGLRTVFTERPSQHLVVFTFVEEVEQ